MNSKIKKAKFEEAVSSGRIHKRSQQPDDLIRFSFKHFSTTDKFNYPNATVGGSYLQILLERLRDVSMWTVHDFRTKKSPALRNHAHDWGKTTEPNGFSNLNAQLKQCEPWQFCLTANEHGRIHGLLIDEVFYIVWLDPLHSLYQGG